MSTEFLNAVQLSIILENCHKDLRASNFIWKSLLSCLLLDTEVDILMGDVSKVLMCALTAPMSIFCFICVNVHTDI